MCTASEKTKSTAAQMCTYVDKIVGAPLLMNENPSVSLASPEKDKSDIKLKKSN